MESFCNFKDEAKFKGSFSEIIDCCAIHVQTSVINK